MPEPLNILQLNTYDKWGGAEKVALQLHRAYLNAGHNACLGVKQSFLSEPHVFSLEAGKKNKPGKKSLRWLKPALENLPRWEGFRYGLCGGLRSADWRQRWSYLREWLQGHEIFDHPYSRTLLERLPFSSQPDIIHGHNLHGGYFDLNMLAKWSQDIPVFLTLHDQWTFTGHCAHSLECLRWKIGCGRCPSLATYPPLMCDGTAYNYQRKREIYAESKLYVVTPSQWLMDCVQQSVLAPAIQEARVIPNGIDLSVFQPGDKQAARQNLKLPIGNDALVLLFAASSIRNNPYKDFKTLEAAVKIASQKLPNLVLIALGEQAKERRIGTARLLFFPFESAPKKFASFYQAADLYVHAAKAETMPLTILEAMACGTPVAATAIGGIPEIITDNTVGLLSASNDIGGMAANILALLEDSQKRTKMGQQAAKQVRVRYAEKHMIKSYLEFYQSVLFSKGRHKSKMRKKATALAI